MKRAGKIALLTKLLQDGSSEANRQRLQHLLEHDHRALIIIDDLTFVSDQPITDSGPVHFQDRGKAYQMTLGEAYQYANRYHIGTLFILPAKHTL